MKTLIAAAVVAVLLAIAGTQAFAATKTVRVRDNFFSPSSVRIHKGSRVTWRFVGSSVHNVTVKSGPQKFRSGNHRRGTFTHRFTRRGTYKIVCTIHSGMRMTVRVS